VGRLPASGFFYFLNHRGLINGQYLLAFFSTLPYIVLQTQHMESFMKTASIPSLRVEPKLRHAVENALHDDETLSSFMEQALREQVKRRQLHDEFIARGLVSRDKAKRTDEYYDASEVLAGLDSILSSAENK